MPSSTSNSNDRITEQSWLKIWCMAFLCTATILGSWEVYWRAQGFFPSLKDDPTLWAITRERVNSTKKKPIALVGASRIQQDICLDVLNEKLQDVEASQLAISGLSPIPLLRNLAEDEKFTGTVICDVTPRLLFVTSESGGSDVELWGKRMMEVHERNSKAGRPYYMPMEDQLRLFVQEHFVIATEAASPRRVVRDKLKGRSISAPHWWIDRDRRQIADYSRIDTQAFRKSRLALTANSERPLTQAQVDLRVSTIKNLVDRISARGGKVIFVRFPSAGELRDTEERMWPREKYWNALAKGVSATCIHFEDYPSLNKFDCPDGSHLSTEDSVAFTRSLLEIIEDELH